MVNEITMPLVADKFIKMALEEDINSEDVTTNSVMPHYKKGQVELICKEDGIVAGLQVFQRVFQLLAPKTEVGFDVQDGEVVQKGQHRATVVGDIRVLLSGERTALNYLQRMSGIATYTNKVAKLLEGTKTTLLDTRKTTPCMRIFEKYAVTVGGGFNHICTNFGYKFEAFEGIGGVIYDERSRTQKENYKYDTRDFCSSFRRGLGKGCRCQPSGGGAGYCPAAYRGLSYSGYS